MVTRKFTSRGADLWAGSASWPGAAVLVAALAVPLDDPVLVVALGLAMRGGRLVLAVDS